MIMPMRCALSMLAALAVAGCTGDSGRTAPPAASTVVVVTSVAPVPDESVATTHPEPRALDAGVFADAAALVAELSAVEAAIREPNVESVELAELGRRQQRAYRAVSRHPEWHAELLAAVAPVARGPLILHLAARQAQADHAATRTPSEPLATVPAWTIVDPLPVDQLRRYYDQAEAATGVPWQYLAAINFQETRMGRIVGESSAGAIGPMQFLPSTWEQCCEGDPTVARDAILGAAQYLVQLGAPADMQAALYGYNPNAGYVGAVTAYAQNMQADPRAFGGYHGWEVFYATSEGTVRLPTGYSSTTPIDVLVYLTDHPDDLLAST